MCVYFVFLHAKSNPLYMLATEIFDSCCSYLALLAGTYYCAADAPEGMLASLSAMITAAVFGAGTLDERSLILLVIVTK